MTITARYPGRCSSCGGHVAVGDQIEWQKGSPVRHAECPSATSAATPAPMPRKRRYGGGVAAPVPGYSTRCTGRSGCTCYDCI